MGGAIATYGNDIVSEVGQRFRNASPSPLEVHVGHRTPENTHCHVTYEPEYKGDNNLEVARRENRILKEATRIFRPLKVSIEAIVASATIDGDVTVTG